STDDTRSVAGAAGAVVFLETHRGKGFVVRRMFSDVEADVYVLVDGDATYDASSVRLMVRRLLRTKVNTLPIGLATAPATNSCPPSSRSYFGSTINDVLSAVFTTLRKVISGFVGRI
ncbi:MAG: glycosyl transferase, partial [Pseudolabrys sp.]